MKRYPAIALLILLAPSPGCSSWFAASQPNDLTPERRLEIDVNDYTLAVSGLTALRLAGVLDDDEYFIAAAAKKEVRKSLDDRRAAIAAGSADVPNSYYRTAVNAFVSGMYKLREIHLDASKRTKPKPATRPTVPATGASQ